MAVFALCTLGSLIIYHVRSVDLRIEPFSLEDQRVKSYDFHDTDEETRCFNDVDTLSNPIPNVVHVIWGFQDPEMTFMNYLVIRSALISLKPDALKLHYQNFNENNVWFQKVSDKISLVHHNASIEYSKQIHENWQVSHLADALRLDVLQREGGIYLDMDVITLRSFDTLRHSKRDVVLGYEGGDRHGLCNAIILARKDAPFLKKWIESYTDFSPKEWNYHSVLLPKELAANSPYQVCPLAPTVFFWPTYTRNHVRYMHEPITKDEALELEIILDANGGSLYPDQLAYHAWNQMAWEKYLQRLTPEIVRERDTRFNVMVRRFLD
jgi:hypothetical protein